MEWKYLDQVLGLNGRRAGACERTVSRMENPTTEGARNGNDRPESNAEGSHACDLPMGKREDPKPSPSTSPMRERRERRHRGEKKKTREGSGRNNQKNRIGGPVTMTQIGNVIHDVDTDSVGKDIQKENGGTFTDGARKNSRWHMRIMERKRIGGDISPEAGNRER